MNFRTLFFACLWLCLSFRASAQLQTTDVTCFGATDGSLSITPNNGQAPFVYFWQRSNGTPSGSGIVTTFGNNALLNALPAGAYSVTITDANGSNVLATATIGSPNALTLNVLQQINNTCANTPSGSLTLTASGGTPPLSFSLDGINYQADSVFTGLAAQSYLARVRDANNCEQNTLITITEPIEVGATLQSQTNVACFGDSTGAFSVVGTGGVPPYSYQLNTDTTHFLNGNFNNLPQGNYTVQITDNLGCSFTLPIALTQNPLLSLTATVLNNATAPTNPNGAATVTATGGNGSFSYQWSNGSTASTAANLLAGIYCITVTDGLGCSASTCVTVSSPPPIVFSATDMLLNCFGNTNGVSTLTASGGVPPYAFSWINAATGATSNGTILINGGVASIPNLTAGVYFVALTDAVGETVADTFSIIEPTPLSISTSSVNVACFGTNSGSVTAIASGGIAPYNIAWSNGGTGVILNGLASGTYYVTATDIGGCTITDSAVVQAPGQALTVLLSKTDISCNGGSNGVAFATVQGGISPYTYLWSNGSTASTAINLPIGVVGVSVTDAFGCSVTQGINIAQPFLLSTVNTAISNAKCFGGNDASAVTVPSGGTTPYSFLWDNGQTAAFADSLTAGLHTVTVTDAKGCTATANVTLGQAPALSLTTSDTTVSCFGFNDGALVAFPSGGTGGYAYKWNSHPFADTFQVSGELFAGAYRVTVTDANGCTITARDTVTQPLPISATATITPTSCNDNFTNDGAATLSPLGGNGGYTYAWNTGSNTNSVNNVVTGRYYFTITDTLGCTYQDSVFVPSPPRLVISDTTMTLVRCYGGADGTATIVPAGGTAPYTYQWLTNPVQTAPTANSLSAGAARVVVNDANGCFMDTVSIFVRQPFLPLDANVSSEAPRCRDGNSGRLSTSPAFGGTAGYVYVWSTGDSTFNVFNVSPGNYNLTITDARGCVTIKTVTVPNTERFYFDVEIEPVTCFDGTDGRVTVVNASGGGGAPFAYGFNFGLVQPDSVFRNLPPTDLQITVRDGLGCRQDTIVTIPNAFEIIVDAGAEQTVFLGDSTQLAAQVNTSNPLTYEWQPTTGLRCSDCSEPVIVPTETNIYTVIVTDSSGCTATDEVLITVIPQRKVFVPNAFTPNNDGVNDVFVPFGGQGVTQINSFQVYDRWGQLLHARTNFQPNDEAFGWDGRHRGGGFAPSGVYVYVLEYEFADGKTQLYTGDVTLFR